MNTERIAIFSLNDRMGGAEQVLKMIALYYAKKNYIVDVFFLTKSTGDLWDSIDNPKISLIYTNSKKENRGLIKFLYNVLRKKVHYKYAFTSHIYLNSCIGFLKKRKLIKADYLIGRDSHSYFLVNKGFKRGVYNFLINFGYSGLDLLISQTDEMKKQFVKNKIRLKEKIKIEVIYNPVDINNMSIMAKEDLKPINSNYIVSAGRLVKIKGFDVLIKAFGKLQFDNRKLIILGEGPERNNLENLILSLNLADKVTLLGYQKNVYPYFKHADLCVISSIKEGFPNVLLQMMSQNTKVVSTLCAGGINEIQGLFTCQPENVEELSNAMMNCLNADTTEYRKVIDDELTNRTIDRFIDNVEFFLNNKHEQF